MKDPLYRIAEFMSISARTAPKAHGEDFITTEIVNGDTLGELAERMKQYAKQSGKSFFARDGKSVRKSDAVLLVSLNESKVAELDCGACGHPSCMQLREQEKEEGPEFAGPICAFRLIDLGIALGSAAKTASLFNVDNRIMYSIGVIARKLELIEGDIVIGIPISATGDSLYFDR